MDKVILMFSIYKLHNLVQMCIAMIFQFCSILLRLVVEEGTVILVN